MTAFDLDRQRRRWSDARRVDRLILSDADDFATGGLGALVESLDMRIRFLPADPLAAVVRLDGEAEKWLSRSRPSPYGGGEPELGRSSRTTASALVRYDSYRDDQGWTRFLGMHRDGSLDFGEGGSIAQYRGVRFARLRPLVGLVWHLAALQVEAAERWSVEGPFEVTVALAGVEGARLGGFAEGWRDVDDSFASEGSICLEPNVLLRVECDVLDPEALAMEFGAQLENVFGSTHRRFIANRGEFENGFDPRF